MRVVRGLLTVLLVTIGVLCWMMLAHADDSVSLRGGWIHTATSNYSDSGSLSVRYEHDLNAELALGGEYTYHGKTERTNGNDSNPYVYGDVGGHSLLGELVYYPKWGRMGVLQSYILTGAGWSWWHFDPSDDTARMGITVNLGDAFAYKLAGGFLIPLGTNWSFDVEASFFKSHIPKEAHHADGTPSILLGDDDRTGRVTIGQEEIGLTAGLKYTF